jgi:hypothetical protein
MSACLSAGIGAFVRGLSMSDIEASCADAGSARRCRLSATAPRG